MYVFNLFMVVVGVGSIIYSVVVWQNPEEYSYESFPWQGIMIFGVVFVSYGMNGELFW
jgi:hypothetical protein